MECGEAIGNLYYPNRQQPPGHNPGSGAGCGVIPYGLAPDGRQSDSRSSDILVESSGDVVAARREQSRRLRR
jgi:hypothetical protein